MLTAVVGNYPKIPSVKDGINLRKAINDEEKGKISKEQLEDICRKSIIRTLNDQVSAGVDIITDGQIRWSDLTWPFTEAVESVHAGGLRRFYDNNVYYRRPQIAGLMSRNGSIVADDYRFAAQHCDKPVKAVLCGPITFCSLSDNHYYKSFNKLAEATAEIIASEVAELAATGCRYIQLDEPALPAYPDKQDMARELYLKIFENIEAEGGIFIYFNSIKNISDTLVELPLKFIGIDLVSHPDDIESIRELPSGCRLIAGLYDGRNIMVENEKYVRQKIDLLSRRISPENIILSPSCGLEFLPQKYALAKLKRMVEVAAKL